MRLNMYYPGLKQINWNTADPAGGASDPAPADPPATPDYSWAPEDFKTDDGYDTEGFRGAYDELVAFQAQQNERLSQVPEAADAYDFAVPEDVDLSEFELPEDFNVKTLFEDEGFKPLFTEFGAMLHKAGAPADVSKQMMGLVAKYEATKYTQAMAAGQAELAKIERAPERVETVKRHLERRLPAEMAEALNFNLTSAAGLQALEKLLSVSGPKPVVPNPGAGDDESLTPLERLKRARAAG